MTTSVELPARVLVVTFGFPPDIGGSETYLGALTEELGHRGVDVTVLAQCRHGMKPSVEQRTARVVVHRARRWSFFRAIRELTAPGISAPPDLVHLHAYTRPLLLQSVLGARQVPIVFSLHGGFTARPFGHSRAGLAVMGGFDRLLAPRLLSRVSVVVTLNETQFEVLVHRYRVDPDRIVRLANMLPPDALADAESEPGSSGRFAVLARLSPEKRVLDVVRALATDLDLPGLDIAGPDGPQAPVIREAARALGPRVRLLGPMNGQARLDFLRSARAVVVPSEWEGQSTTALEAVAQGTPVIISSTSLHGLPRGTFLAYPVGDIAALAASLRSLADPTASDRLRRGAAEARGSLMTLDNHVDRLLEIYARAVTPGA